MKKYALLIAAAILIAAMLTLSGCSKGELIMATEAGFAPYEYYEGQEIVGVDVDIAKEIAKDMGKKLKINDMEFGAITAAVSSGQADFGAAGMSIDAERLEVVNFTVEYAQSKQIIVVRTDSPIAGPADLDAQSIGVQLGTVADFYVQDELPNAQLKQYAKYLESVSDLKNGRLDCIIMDILPAQAILTENPDLKILEEEVFTDSYAICVAKNNQKLLDQINKTLQRLIDEGKIEEFTVKHTTK